MTRRVGTVESVEVRYAGGKVAADAPLGATVLTLDMAVDFDEDGGRLTVNESSYDYVAADHDLLTVTLATPLLDAAEVSDPVWSLDAFGNTETERIAWVDLEDGDPLPVEVSTQLEPYFPEGDAVTGQLVQIELVTGKPTAHGEDASESWRATSRPSQESLFQASVRTSDESGNITGGVNEFGVVTARDLFYDNTFSASLDSMYWDGVLASDMLGLLPKGAPRWGAREPKVTKIRAEYGVMALQLFVQRDCEVLIALSGRIEASVERARFTTRVRHSHNADAPPASATNASPLVSMLDGSNVMAIADNTAGGAGSDYSITAVRGAQLAAGWHDLRWTLESLDPAGGTLDTVSDFAMRVYDMGPALLANGARPAPAPGTLAPGGSDLGPVGNGQLQFYTRTYEATATRWYGGDNVLRGSGDTQYFGDARGESYGNRRAAVWFNGTQIARDLVGATVTKVEAYLHLNSGGNNNTVAIGTHTDPTPRSTFDAIAGRVADRVRSTSWDEGSGRWVDLPFSLQTWKTTYQGIVVGPGPTDDGRYSAAFRGATHPSGPRLRVTFTR